MGGLLAWETTLAARGADVDGPPAPMEDVEGRNMTRLQAYELGRAWATRELRYWPTRGLRRYLARLGGASLRMRGVPNICHPDYRRGAQDVIGEREAASKPRND